MMYSGIVVAVALALGPSDVVGSPGRAGTVAYHDAGAVAEAHDLSGFIREYVADRESIRRFHSEPWCEERMGRMSRFIAEWRARLGVVDFASLDQHGKVDYVLMEHQLGSEAARLSLESKQLHEMEAGLPFRRAILELELARMKMEDVDAKSAAMRIAGIPALVRDAREKVEKGRSGDAAVAATGIKVSPVVARRMAGAVWELRRALSQWYEYNNGYKPEFGWWVTKPYTDAMASMDEYARYLREQVAGLHGGDDDPLLGDPIGAEALNDDLKGAMIAYTPQELIGIAEREFAWCEAEMKKAAADMGLGEDWKAALERVKQDAVPPGEQDALVRELGRGAIKFVKDRDLVTIPDLCDETWRIEMLSTEAQKTLPFAVYGGQYMGVAYATQEMKHEDKMMSMRGNNRHFTRIVTPHELIPGHHLQGYMSQRSRTYRSIFGTPFYVEGWAVYWEMTLWDLGYPQSAEDRVGMLFWRMHRCARIIVSLKFHLGEMTPAQMVDFLVDRVGHERFGATSEVRRYVGGDYSPLYQCGYMVGALQLRALYKDRVGSGKMTAKQFNDGVLAGNSMPIEMVRAELGGYELKPGWVASWKFGE